MKDHPQDDPCRDDRAPCDCLPRPVRMNYFHGQLISERDLRTEQTYFREKLKHAHRCVHGYGILCGMEVRPVEPPEDCLPDDSARRKELRGEIALLEEELKALKQSVSEAEDKEDAEAIMERFDAVSAEREKLMQDLDQLKPDRPEDGCEDDRQPLHLVRVTCGAAIDCDGNDVILPSDRIVDVAALLKPSERDRLGDCHPHRVYLSICYE